jgi:zinc transport system permease protein
MTDFFSLFRYDFLISAIIIGVLVSVCAALLGVSLVLKRYSMIGDGLSHVGFGASAIALAFGIAPLYIAIPAVLAAAFLLLKLGKKSSIKGDAATALVASSALAIGYTVSKLAGGGNVDIAGFMFGSIYTDNTRDLIITVIVSAAVIVLYGVFYNKLFSVTFDENFADATGVNPAIYNLVFAVLTAVTVVLGMMMMGSLLISSLIVIPSLTAMRICKSFKGVVITAAIVSVISFLLGMLIALACNTTPGASIVIVNVFFFIVFSVIGKFKSK